MSLIHEALKRADEEKGERLGGVTPPGPPAADDGPPSRPSPGRLVITVGAVLVAGTLVAYGVLWVAGQDPREATAGVDDLMKRSAAALEEGPVAAPPAVVPTDPLAGQAEQGPATPQPASGATPPSPPDGPTGPAAGPQIDPEVVKQIARSLISEMGLSGGPDPKAGGDIAPSPAAGEGAAPEPSGPRTVPKAVEPTPAPPEPEPAPQHAETKPAPSLPPVDTSRLKVSSIVSGPQGGTAVINGRPVRVGDTIGGATIIKITPRTVEVEIDGRRATLALG